MGGRYSSTVVQDGNRGKARIDQAGVERAAIVRQELFERNVAGAFRQSPTSSGPSRKLTPPGQTDHLLSGTAVSRLSALLVQTGPGVVLGPSVVKLEG